MMWQIKTTDTRRKYQTEEEWRAAKRESSKLSSERRRAENPEEFKRRAREAAKRWRNRNPGAASKATIKWRANLQNRDELNAYRRGWRRKNIIRVLVGEARKRAKARGVEFSICTEDVPPMGDRCPLLGYPFSGPAEGFTPFSPSLDRKDPAKGYVKGNVWIVGYRANLIKNDGTAEEHALIATAMHRALSN
jgi:hypothetical protein